MRLIHALVLAGVAFAKVANGFELSIGGNTNVSFGPEEDDVTFEELTEWNDADQTCKNSFQLERSNVRGLDACKTNCENNDSCMVMYFELAAERDPPKRTDLCVLYRSDTCSKQRNVVGTSYLAKRATATPSGAPTAAPSTGTPTGAPTAVPSTGTPTGAPTAPPSTGTPTGSPTAPPSTGTPTGAPTAPPSTGTPTGAPTAVPSTGTPTGAPTAVPSTGTPTGAPTSPPSTEMPSPAPTSAPSTGMPSAAPTSSPTTAGMLEFELMVMPDSKSSQATTSNAVSVKFLMGDGTWTDKMELFSSCSVAGAYCGKELLISAETVTKVMFINDGSDNFKTGEMKMKLNGMDVYVAEGESKYEWVVGKKTPQFALTTVPSCPIPEKTNTKIKLVTGRGGGKGGGGTTDQCYMALKMKCTGWMDEYFEYSLEADKTDIGDLIQYKLKKLEGEVEAIMLYKDGFDPWNLAKIQLQIDDDKQSLIERPVWIGDNFGINAAVFPMEKTREDMKDLCKKVAKKGECASDCTYAFSDPKLSDLIPDWLTMQVCENFPGGKYTELCPEECGIKPLCAKISSEGKCAEDCSYALTDSDYFTFLPNWLISEICESPDGKYTELCPDDCPTNKLQPTD